ncbi:MAG: Dam family site-specific DNA-(adenine-N6)-methyltransferase [candidate division WOR-3 bacterium]|nr:Dam family site-specific DNA-(adenine-N6)-methyltransferase [candidate division WOR-3 bacterium]
MTNSELIEGIRPKPFLKWAGGKGQMLDEIIQRIPKKNQEQNKIDTYIEPFLGGGAVFFHLKTKFDIKRSYLIDLNKEIIIAYKVIQKKPLELINRLDKIESEYKGLTKLKRKKYYYKVRSAYNSNLKKLNLNEFSDAWIKHSSFLIFLNKTCFNGLYRVNSKNQFNVPHGSYKNPTICDDRNILAVSETLSDAKLLYGDFELSREFIEGNTLIYFDPPYRPLNNTSSFNSYNNNTFDDEEQKRLANFFREVDQPNVSLILSNSDPKNIDSEDTFFDDLYKGYKIDRVYANRMINSKGKKRGKITEIIILNSREEI